MEEDELVDLFISIVAGTMNKEKCKYAHPRLSAMIKQLSQEDAIILMQWLKSEDLPSKSLIHVGDRKKNVEFLSRLNVNGLLLPTLTHNDSTELIKIILTLDREYNQSFNVLGKFKEQITKFIKIKESIEILEAIGFCAETEAKNIKFRANRELLNFAANKKEHIKNIDFSATHKSVIIPTTMGYNLKKLLQDNGK